LLQFKPMQTNIHSILTEQAKTNLTLFLSRIKLKLSTLKQCRVHKALTVKSKKSYSCAPKVKKVDKLVGTFPRKKIMSVSLEEKKS